MAVFKENFKEEKNLIVKAHEDNLTVSSREEVLEKIDGICQKLTDPQARQIIDEILEENGASQKLEAIMFNCREKIAKKTFSAAVPNGHAIDVFGNLEASLRMIDRAMKNGLPPAYREAIKENLTYLFNYAQILESSGKIRSREIASKSGSWQGKQIEKEHKERLDEIFK